MKISDNKSLESKNVFLSDILLFQAAARLPQELLAGFEEIGAFVTSSEAHDLARLANHNPPELNFVDSWGQKQQHIEIHPAYHALVRRAKKIGLASSLWENSVNENGVRYQARAIRLLLTSGLENGHLSETITTSAGITALMGEKALYHMWKDAVLNRQHDSSELPVQKKKGASFAFAFEDRYAQTPYNMTEDGAKVSSSSGLEQTLYHIDIMKKHVANPNADAFFVTAKLRGQPSCFFVPRFLDNDMINHIKIDHMIYQPGYRSRPLADLHFQNSFAWLIGMPGEGMRIVNDIETMLRFDEAVVSVGNLRAALQYAITFLKKRMKDGIEPITLRVFADIALDIAAAQAFILRLAHAFDHAFQDKNEAAFARVMTPVATFWINNLVGPILSELIAHSGVESYGETSILSRLFNDSCIRTIRGNTINSLIEDVVDSAQRAPNLLKAMIADLGQKIDTIGIKTTEVLYAAMQISLTDIGSGRLLVEQMAYTAALAALRDYEMAHISLAFAESRLGGQWRSSYGMLSARHNVAHILETLYPSQQMR